MKAYTTSQSIMARPMSRGEYNALRGWTVPADEDPKDGGYLITKQSGYIQWLPTLQFVQEYREQTESEALTEAQAQAGERSEAAPSGLGGEVERELDDAEVRELLTPLFLQLGLDPAEVNLIRLGEIEEVLAAPINQSPSTADDCSCLACETRRLLESKYNLEQSQATQAEVAAQAAANPVTYDFGTAIKLLKDGQAVARSGWNGKGMFLYLVPANAYMPTTAIGEKIADQANCYGHVPYLPYIAMRTVDGSVVPWLASQTDVLADDWTVVDL